MARAIENVQEVKYVYDLPYGVRKQLCSILDVNDAWEELGRWGNCVCVCVS
ncbi:hypothetical protein E2C01_064769 [Portunus trituberculatus]|uniref:Uncharacterized protein n=1 Tax=Portunus trituberculatus TaxID=210409 RepID=A0A5B7HDY4_PORTR|nr:hypothetical protein [Portunus trituberculatus]